MEKYDRIEINWINYQLVPAQPGSAPALRAQSRWQHGAHGLSSAVGGSHLTAKGLAPETMHIYIYIYYNVYIYIYIIMYI